MALIIQTKLVYDFIHASIVHSETLLQYCSCYSNTRGVTALPPNRNLDPRFGRSSGSNRNSDQTHTSSLLEDEAWIARMKEDLALLSCLFLSVVAPLYLEEHDHFMPRDTVLLIQDLDGMLGV
jgi:hypothetical protein